jgi:hypothetical protein
MKRMRTHPAIMIKSKRVIAAWPRGRLRTRWLRISASSEASRKSDADIAKDRRVLTAGLNRWGRTILHFGTMLSAAMLGPEAAASEGSQNEKLGRSCRPTRLSVGPAAGRRASRSGVTSTFALCAIAVLWRCTALGDGALSHTHTTIATSPTNAVAASAAKQRSTESKLKS